MMFGNTFTIAALACAATLLQWTARASQPFPKSVTVTHGYLDGAPVGNYTSLLQKFIDSLPVVTADQLRAPVQNATTTLRYLRLEGDYFADVPLKLPSCFVLKFAQGSSLRAAANLSCPSPSRFSSLVSLNGTSFSAVIGEDSGGTIDARAVTEDGVQLAAISIVNGHHNIVKGVRALAAAGTTVVGINGGSMNEVASSDLGGEDGAPLHGRCVWCLATSRAYVHGNRIHHCSAHALDFDAYTSNSVAASNLCEDNGEEGIFVEETARVSICESSVIEILLLNTQRTVRAGKLRLQ